MTIRTKPERRKWRHFHLIDFSAQERELLIGTHHFMKINGFVNIFPRNRQISVFQELLYAWIVMRNAPERTPSAKG